MAESEEADPVLSQISELASFVKNHEKILESLKDIPQLLQGMKEKLCEPLGNSKSNENDEGDLESRENGDDIGLDSLLKGLAPVSKSTTDGIRQLKIFIYLL